jgi:hypothetical protein
MVTQPTNKGGIAMELQKPINKSDVIRNLDMFTRSYLVAALWSSSDDDDEQLDKNYNLADFSVEFLQRAVADCAAFCSATEEKSSTDGPTLAMTSGSRATGTVPDFGTETGGMTAISSPPKQISTKKLIST